MTHTTSPAVFLRDIHKAILLKSNNSTVVRRTQHEMYVNPNKDKTGKLLNMCRQGSITHAEDSERRRIVVKTTTDKVKKYNEKNGMEIEKPARRLSDVSFFFSPPPRHPKTVLLIAHWLPYGNSNIIQMRFVTHGL